MRFTLATVLATAVAVSATLDPCTTNSKNKVPKRPACSPSESSDDIQAAECSHNTRLSDTQTFAVWTRTKTNSNGISYGTCEAYSCTAPTKKEMTAQEGGWTFFWNSNGVSEGFGTGCIQDPNTGECGCENSNGDFIVGSDSCS
ncbi:putative small secreted protein [Neofusicoccum parvum]|uniref:Small secreted protein n=2 Tax=Neofusicoccum parvum TaxID=310453 RepID=A0ACB5SMZ1_9PEZI|nr:putative small secreted protein [Neofusicoccum parvum UCRNP2]GME48745.1 putative small secreted protein [Neofusicoccum parvum]GME49584.1 putative small secreted protein [Neofusicoccum parvum]